MTREEAIQKLRRALNQVSPDSPDSLLQIPAQVGDAKEENSNATERDH